MTKPYNANMLDVDTCDCVIRCVKKPIPMRAVQINDPAGFTVDTREGHGLLGKPGDYLMIGVENERWIIDKQIFEKTYEVLNDNT